MPVERFGFIIDERVLADEAHIADAAAVEAGIDAVDAECVGRRVKPPSAGFVVAVVAP